MDALKVGLLGLGRGGLLVADALAASSWCTLVAAASAKADRRERFAERHPGVSTYDDLRSLIVENPLDALFVAIPPFARGPYLDLAVERRLPVWMITPAARRFEECLEIIDKFDRAECPIAVSRAWGQDGALTGDSIGMDALGRVFLARGRVMTCWADDLDWRGDAKRAGGGVLLHRGYSLVDTLVQTMGMPTSVFVAAGGVSRPRSRHAYDTEDTAALIARFPGGGVAAISACWTSGRDQSVLVLHAVSGSVRIDDRSVAVCDLRGEAMLPVQKRAVNPFAPQVHEFLASLRLGSPPVPGSLRDHLPTMSVIQAGYLSARTEHAERPAAIFDMHDTPVPPSQPRWQSPSDVPDS
jgi:predicted dehydrogenase